MASFGMTVRARGHRARRVRVEHVRHLGTLTGRGNAGRDLYRVVSTGHEFELVTPDAADLFPSCMRVRESEARLFGLEARP